MLDPAEAIAALEEAYASGELTVEYAGRRVTFQSAAEIERRIAYFQRKLTDAPAGQPAGAGASRATYAAFVRD